MIKTWLKRISYIWLLLSLLVPLSVGMWTAVAAIEREVIPHPHPVFHVEFDGMWELSFEEARDLTLYLDGLYDKMGESPYPAPSHELLNDLTTEALPFFEYEGMGGMARWASPISLHAYQEARRHIHTAGQSNCAGHVLNYRHANPFSSWYAEGSWVATAIHEMVHVQQGGLCNQVDHFYLENTAEIASLEVMAGMVNYGNRDMTYALVRKLRGMAASAAYGIAANEGHPEKYVALREQILDDPYRDAAFNKSRRYWANDPERLDFILRAYSIVPFEKIVQAILYEDNVIEGLILPPGQVIGGTFVPGSPFLLDDLAYFLEHSEEIVARYVQELDEK